MLYFTICQFDFTRQTSNAKLNKNTKGSLKYQFIDIITKLIVFNIYKKNQGLQSITEMFKSIKTSSLKFFLC